MFFRDLRPKSDVTFQATLAEVKLPVRMGHRDAETIFVRPFAQQLAAAGLGAVTGFDVHRDLEHEVRGLDLYLGLIDTSRPALMTVTRMLDFLGAPYGSSIRLTDAPGDPILFGTTEGLELAIGSDAAPDAAARKELAKTCCDAIDANTISRGWTRRRNQTLFYFYGENFHEMKARLGKLLDDDERFSGVSLRRLA